MSAATISSADEVTTVSTEGLSEGIPAPAEAAVMSGLYVVNVETGRVADGRRVSDDWWVAGRSGDWMMAGLVLIKVLLVTGMMAGRRTGDWIEAGLVLIKVLV